MSNEVGRLRISCAALARLRDDQGRYLLGLNLDRLRQGRSVYLPLGGALRYDDPRLPERFNAIPEEPGSFDLRLLVPRGRVRAFRDWFLTRTERETSVLRELHEELVDEFRVLPALEPGDAVERYAGFYEARGISDRRAAFGSRTLYLHEIYDVEIISATARATLASVTPDSGLRWFTRETLLRGYSEDGLPADGGALLAV
ncbi:MAG: hypothetical protein DIU68_010715 [Chloroflexota bacterium]|nr:MAG: hypothetical protein DIU68_05315 [Chloroflexota bacterium]